MDAVNWNPGTLLQLSGSYWQAFALHTGVKLDVFSILARGAMSAEQMARKLHADVRATATLLNALAAMGLLEKKAHIYQATQPAVDYLSKTSPAYVGHMILHHHHLTKSWIRMDDAVRTGRPVRERVSSSDEDKVRQAFLMGMYNMASQQASQIAAAVDLKGRRRLLDLGGGPGTYAIYFCKQYPDLEAVVFDLPTTRPFAEQTIASHSLSDRISFIPGDYNEAQLEGSYDAAWLSHILHAEGPDDCQALLRKVVGVLKPGGVILIHEFFLNENMDGPLFPALFSLNMLQGTEQGRSYSEIQIREMLSKVGVGGIIRLPYTGPTESGILLGTLAG